MLEVEITETEYKTIVGMREYELAAPFANNSLLTQIPFGQHIANLKCGEHELLVCVHHQDADGFAFVYAGLEIAVRLWMSRP